MCADRSRHPVVHLVGSVPLPDCDSIFRTVAAGVGPHLARLPDGETGKRKMWIKFLQDVLAENPAIEVAHDLAPFKFTQWDGKVIREIPRLRIKKGAVVDPKSFVTGYADMAIYSFASFHKLRKRDVIPAGVKFQICMPTPLAPTYNNMVPSDRTALIPALTLHFIGEIEKIAKMLPNDRIAIQWDVCQEVLAWEGYYEPGPVEFETETIDVLARIGDAVPPAIDLGYHLCYGSPADEHMVLLKDPAIMVDMTNEIAARVKRSIEFFHLPVAKDRNDDAFFAPLDGLKLRPETELYLGLIHYDDSEGDDARLAAARCHVRVDGIGTECGWGRKSPDKIPALLDQHRHIVEKMG